MIFGIELHSHFLHIPEKMVLKSATTSIQEANQKIEKLDIHDQVKNQASKSMLDLVFFRVNVLHKYLNYACSFRT